MTIGERIRERRKRLGLTADQLGEMIGKNRATIYRYESDDIENMSISIIPPLAAALRCSPAYLMGWSDIETDDISNEDRQDLQSLELAKRICQMPSESQKIVTELVEKLREK